MIKMIDTFFLKGHQDTGLAVPLFLRLSSITRKILLKLGGHSG